MKTDLSPVDKLLFPIRALFVPEENLFGLASLRTERFAVVAEQCRGKVLDVGCGRNNLFIRNHIGEGRGVGIDVFKYEGVENVVEDLTNLPYEDASFDTITLIAVGGHIPQHARKAEFAEFARVLKPGGRLIMTEGEPITQTVGHKWRHFTYALVGKQDMDSERGMEEEEQYCIPYNELMGYLNTSPFKLVKRKKFMWGLNNLYVAERQ